MSGDNVLELQRWWTVTWSRMWHLLLQDCSRPSVVRNLPANAGDTRDVGSIPESGKFPGGGNGKLLQYSCLENPMDRRDGGLQSIGSQRVRHD